MAEDAQLGIWQYYDQECVPLFAQELRKPENEDLLKWARSLANNTCI
ncbi:hypothetical protein [Acaryochloris sp. CCMEE 5410]|nr:hypothetical protein [Acaryochloris sp. CCMEE 5410]KAI9129899.1 hypothetical protein ON05_029970 [Acaryochloris sp. CCMEE 5410]